MSTKQLFKKTFISLTLLINALSNHAQSWEPLTTGLTLTSGTPFVSAMCVYNGKLIVAGNFDNAGGVPVNNIAAWDETDWSPLGNGITLKHFSFGNQSFPNCNGSINYLPSVRCLAVYNNELYAGGDFVNADGKPVYSIAKWNGTNWSTVGGGLIKTKKDDYGYAGIKDMLVFNNELYVAGSFDSIGNIAASNLAKWNGNTWSTVGGGVKNIRLSHPLNKSKVWTIHAYDNKLFVGGVFDTVGVNVPAKNIAAWDGSNWSSFGNGIPATGINTTTYLGVTEINDFMGNIYAGNSTSGISKWNGSYWQSVGGGVSNYSSSGIIYSSLILNNNLIVTGKYSSSGNIQNTFQISSWNGTNWSHFGPTCNVSNISQSGMDNGCISNSVIFNNYLYVSGAFSGVYNSNVTTNGTCISFTTKNIARLSSPIGIKENEKGSNEVVLYPNPATNEIHLSLNQLAVIEKIIVRELSGKDVFNLSIPKTQETTINTSDLKPGAYFIEVKTNTGILTKPFIKITE